MLQKEAFAKDGAMPIERASGETGGAREATLSKINDQQQVTCLNDEVERHKQELLLLVVTSFKSKPLPSDLQGSIQTAGKALKHCREARSHLKKAFEYYMRMRTEWNEIQRRKNFLLQLKQSLSAIERLRSLAKTICDAKSNGEHGLMSESCVLFESENSAFRGRMDEVFVSLHSVAHRVSLAVATSMRMLRASLRTSCTKFDRKDYSKCMQDFQDLGAAPDFPSHVLQAFEEESNRIFEDAVCLEAKSSQKAITFFSKLSSLLAQFICIVRFHAESPSGGDKVIAREELRMSMSPLFGALSPPFRHFAKLAVRLISDLKFSLLGEQTTALLHVFEAGNSICSLTVVGNSISSFDTENVLGFRAKSNSSFGSWTKKQNESASVQLRRGGSQSNLGGEKDARQRKASTRRAWEQDFHRPIMKAMKELACDRLSAAHVRHAEELKMITDTPESWVRIRLTEEDVRILFQELRNGINGRTSGTEPEGSDGARNNGESWAIDPFKEMNATSVTFTTASLAMLRWLSEYAKIGVTVTDSLPDALGDITDIFLILLHASVDVKSRIDTPESESLLQVIEDVLLERPQPRCLESFINPACKGYYWAFLDRYMRQGNVEDVEVSNSHYSRWGLEHKIDLMQYSLAAGQLFPTPFASDVAIVRQCVAAEGINTFCEVIEGFSGCIIEKVQHHSNGFEDDATHRIASLHSAVVLGREIRNAFYELLAWDIIGGWQAVSAVAETCRSFHELSDSKKGEIASSCSGYVHEMLARIESGFVAHALPPAGAERMSLSICETAMGIVLEGFSRVRYCTHTAAASQILVDIRTLDLALVEFTGIHPCPGRIRTEMYVKATFLDQHEIVIWAQKHQRRLRLSDKHIKALRDGSKEMEISILEQIITP